MKIAIASTLATLFSTSPAVIATLIHFDEKKGKPLTHRRALLYASGLGIIGITTMCVIVALTLNP